MKAVHVLFRRHRKQYARRIHLWRQGQLHQNPVDLRMPVEPVDNLEQSLRRNVRRRGDGLALHAELVACPRFVLYVNLGSGIVPHQNNRQPRGSSALVYQLLHARQTLGLYLIANLISVEYLGQVLSNHGCCPTGRRRRLRNVVMLETRLPSRDREGLRKNRFWRSPLIIVSG